MEFKIVSEFTPTGDQPQAIEKISSAFKDGETHQTLLGITGSGKTFTVANIVKELQTPTLVLAHNKTLAAQLYEEFKEFFPENAVEYFVSYYDYYQPEAYIASSGTYIEKDLSINEEIDKMRLSTISSLLSGRRDVLVVASVSCIYGIGNPNEFSKGVIEIQTGQEITHSDLMKQFVAGLYSRTEGDFLRGNFRVQGERVDVFPSYSDLAIRILFWGNEIDEIFTFDPATDQRIETMDSIRLFPANLFVTSFDTLQLAIRDIQTDLVKQVDFFKETHKNLEAKRLEERTLFDLEMIKELGYCSGIENYSRYLDRRNPGDRPFCLLDYFPNDYLMVIDESHVTLSQVHAMYGGDRSRKESLVEYGFRLPAAMDNRPLKFSEFEQLQKRALYVSATPADYELEKTEGEFVEQIIRPTGLLDPVIEVVPSKNQIDHLIAEIKKTIQKDERILVTTLTKRMAVELTNFLVKAGINTQYIHSDVDTIDRIEIMQNLRKGIIDVIVGINLLREGLDLPEVSLVAILDADKEGFLRSYRSLTQTAGRAARNVNGRVIFYADKITKSMEKTMEETKRHREKQMAYNKKHNKKPKGLTKKIGYSLVEKLGKSQTVEVERKVKTNVDVSKLSKKELEKEIRMTKKQMEEAAKNFDFMKAAELRDKIKLLQEG